jgi:4-hydroxy-tetrahydrodipicolinate reductase
MSNAKVVVAGAAGRMGRALLREVLKAPGLMLAGAFERADSAFVGADAAALAGMEPVGLKVAPDAESALRGAAVLIDFTAAGAAAANARAAAAAGAALVLGTTGLSADDMAEVESLARKVTIVRSGNFSLGVNLVAGLVEEAARRLPDDFDIEIFEAHHRDKIDSPSGTALMLGRAAAAGRGCDLAARSVRVRDGAVGPRRAGDIGFSVMRGGGIVGEHRVAFAGADEIVEIRHCAIDRALFAKGAIAAAKWALGKPAGLYSMRDVLGFPDRK